MIELSKFEMGSRIPKVIHQTYPCKERLPAEIQANIRKMCRLNCGWEHRLYDDADIETVILRYYGPEVLQVYRRINRFYGAARADFFRYLLMYAEGGVYLDIKSSATRPLDNVIASDDRYVLSKWGNRLGGIWGLHRELEQLEGGEYQQWYIVSVAGHPFLRAVIERVLENIQQYNMLNDGVGQLAVLRTTGPIAYTLAIENVKTLHPFREVDISRDFGFEYSIYGYFGPRGTHTHLFKKHYACLKTPLISPRVFSDYFAGVLFYLRECAMKLLQKFLSAKA